LYYWFLHKTKGESVSELLLSTLLSAITAEDLDGNIKGVPPPYYEFEDVARHALSQF
jgi:hypothetical protein